ncbi:ankyrin repeat protein [Streptomyces sp. V4I8]|uniref:ankyrin repeat domain-containing protein n=1 Tax=Streptomyces sp. V4I8 TaxID=3156469 RepID=UPI00351455C5
MAFGQWTCARRLVERGARTTLWQAAALGETDRVAACFTSEADPPTAEDITNALWCACHGGQHQTADYLLRRGGDLNRVGHDRLTALDAADRAGHPALVAWLREQGARSAAELV